MIQMTHAYDIKTTSLLPFVVGLFARRYTEQAFEQTLEEPVISDAMSL